MALRSRGGPEVVQTANNAEHGRQSQESSLLAEAGVGAETELDVRVQGTVQTDFVGVREDTRVAVGLDL